METKEIKSTLWEAFCKKLREIRPRLRLTIERVEPDGKLARVVNDLELRQAQLNRTGACNDIISFTLEEQSGAAVEYTITEPIHIKLRQEDSDRYNAMEIIAENGTHILSARPGFRQDLVEELV
jgi:hypothetical protein